MSYLSCVKSILELMNKKFYFLFVNFIFISSTSLNAAVYDQDVLDILSKLTPRLILMSSQKNHLKDKIEICILHDAIDELISISFVDKLQNSYPNGIKNYPLKLRNITYSKIDECQNSQLIFMFDSGEQNIEKALKYAREHTAMSMSYNPKYLDNGANASLFLGRKVTPYLNVYTAQKNQIEFDNILVRISKIHLKEDVK